MNRIDFGEELARQSRRALDRVTPGQILADGSIQGIQSGIRYSSGVVAIDTQNLALAESHGWRVSKVAAVAGCIAVERD